MSASPAMGGPVACLPMYDWPEIRSATDRYWLRLAESLRDHGFAAPDGLERERDRHAVWLDPGLVLGQTCGLPYVLELAGRVSLVGRPAYDIECGAGCYYSVLVTPLSSKAQNAAEAAEGGLAFNDRRSQSGFAALHQGLALAGACGRPWQETETGSHRQSIIEVAAGRAGLAAIDAVSFELAKRHEPAARNVRVIGRTAVMPGLPYITARRSAGEVGRLHDAVCHAMASLDEAVRDELLLIGFDPAQPADYQPIARAWQRLDPALHHAAN